MSRGLFQLALIYAGSTLQVTAVAQEGGLPPALAPVKTNAPISIPLGVLHSAIGDVPARPRLELPQTDGPKIQDSFRIIPDPIPLGALTDERRLESAFQPAFVATFDDPCEFSYTGRGRYGELISRDTLFVYEGMRLAIAADGQYEISFVSETPRLPVVVRLQLQICEKVDGLDMLRGTITLAPITLQADSTLDRHKPSQSYIVRRQGYSHLIGRLQLSEHSKAHRDFSIRRTGVARFGSIPEQAVYAPILTESESSP